MSTTSASPISNITVDEELSVREEDFSIDSVDISVKEERESSLSPMLTPPHTPTDASAAARRTSSGSRPNNNSSYDPGQLRPRRSHLHARPYASAMESQHLPHHYQRLHQSPHQQQQQQHQHRVWLQMQQQQQQQQHQHQQNQQQHGFTYNGAAATQFLNPADPLAAQHQAILMNQWLRHAALYQQHQQHQHQQQQQHHLHHQQQQHHLHQHHRPAHHQQQVLMLNQQYNGTDQNDTVHQQRVDLSYVDDKRKDLGMPPALTVTSLNQLVAESSDRARLGYVGRPIKLPLRKHHSFHFQTSQTVAGQQQLWGKGKLSPLRKQQQQRQPSQEMPYSKRYASEGPLVFRPLCLNENRAFKPISPPADSGDCEGLVKCENPEDNGIKSEPDDQRPDEKCELISEVMIGEVFTEVSKLSKVSKTLQQSVSLDDLETCTVRDENEVSKVSTAPLHPAASLEALEALTKNNPHLLYATQAGSRQNLHNLQMISSSPAKSREPLSSSQQSLERKTAINTEDEEDQGYSFCEDEEEEEDENKDEGEGEDEEADNYENSPNATVILSASQQLDDCHVKYIVSQSQREIHI